ncbi:rhomboid family intramembrane serine protease [Pararhodobacter sp. SW119]|uniref:rhomboid family intramembrane serine protease n=1 Tax=Pararhodobacter sp. SW119 TaxID=2780075 RepID=UPI001ADF419C|nr:rhomboid family intramembrane serine protease [Pararhodobacter sp. SW119]
MNRRFRSSADSHAPIVLWIVALCALPEVVFTLLETPLFDLPDVRRAALLAFAFWPPLLSGGWQTLWPGQSVSMFVTYAFLHVGFLHLLFNMLVLVQLGRECVGRLGEWGFSVLYLLSAIGGAAGFLLLPSSSGPMVGASGAIFGLFGAVQYWDWQRRRATGASLGPFWKVMFGLVLMNVLLLLLVGSYLAWQAHLGGYIAGFLVARLVTPTLGHRARGFH